MGKSVLIVDDSRISRLLIRRSINNLPYIQNIREADKGEIALALYKESRDDLVLLDLTMEGGMDGYQTLAELKKMDPNVQVIVVSADIQKKAKEKTAALGALNFVNKPFNKEELQEQINKVLNHD